MGKGGDEFCARPVWMVPCRAAMVLINTKYSIKTCGTKVSYTFALRSRENVPNICSCAKLLLFPPRCLYPSSEVISGLLIVVR